MPGTRNELRHLPATRAMIAAALLTMSTPGFSQTASDSLFLKNLTSIGATEGEQKRLVSIYQQGTPEERARLDANTPAQSREMLDGKRRAWAGEDAHPLLALGSSLPQFALSDTNGKIVTPASFKDAKLLVVAFMSVHCPASQMTEGRLMKLAEDFKARGVEFIAIQPDSTKATAPSELNYTDVDDDLAGMRERVRFRKWTIPFLQDGDKQTASAAFGPKTTPHIFIFDAQRKLRYEGRIDNNLRPELATTHEARDAIEALLADKPVPVDHTPTFGCSIKWGDLALQTGRVEKAQAEWKARPVTVDTISLEGLKALRTTPPGKLTIINFWATWCGPCKVEMPDIVQTYQWYNNRGVDLVTVSVDDPQARPAVLQFLKDVHSPVRNLQVDSNDVFAVQAAFDPDWQSGVPYTLVLAPDGSVIYRQEGELDVLRMRRAILASFDTPGPFAGNAAYWQAGGN